MNCRKVEKLLPLYAAGDLLAVQEANISTHLAACPACRQLAAEYEASQNWLLAAGAPEFGEDSLAALRGAIRQEIAEAVRPAQPARWTADWRWQWAAGATLLLLSCGLALYLTRSGQPRGPLTARRPDQPPQRIEAPARSERTAAQATAPRRVAFTRTRRTRGAKSVAPIHLATIAAAPLIADPAVQTNDAAGTEPDMLRIEIQTADPNIRIIWFAPKEPALGSAKSAETR